MSKYEKQNSKKRICIYLSAIALFMLVLIAGIIYFSKGTNKDEHTVQTIITDTIDVSYATVNNDTEKTTVSNDIDETTAGNDVEDTPAETASTTPPTEPETSAPLFDISNLPASAYLDVKFISQRPSLPTGCEITSLTEVLNYLGFDIDKETLANNYLEYDYEVRPGIFMDYFYGSPYDPNACGCFAPALTTVANKYLKDMDSSYRAHNISYSAISDLFAQVASGNPVIVWTSLDYSTRYIEYQTIYVSPYETFDWPLNEHCVALIGYDINNNTVTFADPTYGIVSHSIDDFAYYYGKFYSQAIVIQ